MEFFEFSLGDVEALIRRGFAEDFAFEDLTSHACVEEASWARAQVILKEAGCIAGLPFIPWIFHLYDPRIETQIFVRDGEKREKGTVLAELIGPARSILSAERVALNFLQHLSGVATLTAECVERVRGTNCQILDTRKTILGLRALQKYAVRMGGGTNHRLHLADRILIKNNHLVFAPDLYSCIRRAQERYLGCWIEVEIGSPEYVEEALRAGAQAILLDNMSPEEVREAVRLNRKRAYLEASGGITAEKLPAYAAAGVDGISIGALTHSAPALDLSLRVCKI